MIRNIRYRRDQRQLEEEEEIWFNEEDDFTDVPTAKPEIESYSMMKSNRAWKLSMNVSNFVFTLHAFEQIRLQRRMDRQRPTVHRRRLQTRIHQQMRCQRATVSRLVRHLIIRHHHIRLPQRRQPPDNSLRLLEPRLASITLITTPRMTQKATRPKH